VFHTDVAKVQLTLSVFLLGFALSQLIYGRLSDRYGRRPILVLGLVIYLAATLACVLSTSIEALILARFFQALGGCCGPVLGRAVVRDVYGIERAARMLAYMGAAMALAPALGPIIGGYLTTWFDWKANFFSLAAFAALCLAGVLAWLPETNAHKNARATSPGVLLDNYAIIGRHPHFLGYALCVAFGYSVIFVFISGSSFVLVDVLGVKPEYYGYCFATAVVGYIAGAIGPFAKMAGAVSALMGFIQMSCAAAVGYGVGHLHDGTPVPMAIAMAAVGCAGLATYWFVVRRAKRD
jgi:DHA1 family bicyclomycin/chloramphenicol resistance-like MFS transporter